MFLNLSYSVSYVPIVIRNRVLVIRLLSCRRTLKEGGLKVLPYRIWFHKRVANHGRRAPLIKATKEQQALIHNQQEPIRCSRRSLTSSKESQAQQ